MSACPFRITVCREPFYVIALRLFIHITAEINMNSLGRIFGIQGLCDFAHLLLTAAVITHEKYVLESVLDELFGHSFVDRGENRARKADGPWQLRNRLVHSER